ncbi:cache domain-containing protein [Arcobacter sp. LA11]|uniref:sensor histidine kinase n=1 Tax=Arcobacter sp. LA11 TaxID=1898176 RepID=UPI0009349543|nr:cache domain-containing protein [Arcobacter sp. LA11]
MSILKNENTILNIIKFGPIFFVIILSFLITQIFLNEKRKSFLHEVQLIENSYLDNNKKRVKNEIERVYNLIKSEKEKAEELLRIKLKERVYEAHQIATNIYNNEMKYVEHLHSKEDIFQIIKIALGGIIYNEGRGYFFISDENGTNLLQPLNKELEGKNFSEFTDINGNRFAKKFIDVIKNKTESYDTYFWYREKDDNAAYMKISFYKYFEPFNIAIGTGEYIKDFEIKLKKELLERIKSIRYGNNSYIFVYDTKGNSLAHLNDSLVGINRMDVKDKNGRYIVKDVIDFAKESKSGFMTYDATVNPDKELNSNNKISYIKLFEDWNWVIGSGFYLENLNKKLDERKAFLEQRKKKAFNKIIVTVLVITLIFIIISFYISKIIANRFKKYRADIEKEMQKAIEKEKLLIQQSKMATMGEMIGNIAHQWKQPLSVISASNGMLKFSKEFDNFTEQEFDDATVAIDDSVKNLSTTIDDFRNFFNPNKKHITFNLEEAFSKTFKLISSQFKNNNIEIIEDIKSVEIYGLENELLQTLINILKNAKEELVKKDKKERRLLFIKTKEKSNQVKIKIRDNAGGIPEEILEKVFEAYFTTKEEEGGTGIGLYMSKQIIERMHGKLIVRNVNYTYEDVEYKGAEFVITLYL